MALDRCVRFLLAGIPDRPEFEQVDALLTKLESLPDFSKRVVPVAASEWTAWLAKTIADNHWEHYRFQGKLVVIREVALRNGDRVLVGGAKELYAYAKKYYNITPSCSLQEAKLRVVDQKAINERKLKRKNKLTERFPLISICFTAAGTEWCAAITACMLSRRVCPLNTRVALYFLVPDGAQWQAAEDLKAEIEECLPSGIHSVTITQAEEVAFRNADYVVVLDRASGLLDCETDAAGTALNLDDKKVRQLEVLKEYKSQMIDYAKSICEAGKDRVRVVVAGQHSDIAVSAIWKVFEEQRSVNVAAKREVMTSLSHCQYYARSLIAKTLKVPAYKVTDVVTWGKLDRPCLVSVCKATKIHQHDGGIYNGAMSDFIRPLDSLVPNRSAFYKKDLPQKTHAHGRIEPTPYAIGNTVVDTLIPMLHWPKQVDYGLYNNSLASLGLVSEGQYEVPKGLVFGFPVHFNKVEGRWMVDESLPLEEAEVEDIKKGAANMHTYMNIIDGVKPPTPPQSTETSETSSSGTSATSGTSGTTSSGMTSGTAETTDSSESSESTGQSSKSRTVG